MCDHFSSSEEDLRKMAVANRQKQGLTYVSLGMEHLDEAMSLISKYYIPEQPICMGLEATYEDVGDVINILTSNALEKHLPVGAINSRGDLIGILMVEIERNEDSIFSDVAIHAEGKIKAKRFLEVVKNISKKYDVFNAKGVKEVLELSVLTIHPDYCHLEGKCEAIVKNMVEMAEKEAAKKGIALAKLFVFGNKCNFHADMLGYETFAETQYKDFNFFNLKAMGDHKCGRIMLKKLI